MTTAERGCRSRIQFGNSAHVPTCEVKSVEWPKVMNEDEISEFQNLCDLCTIVVLALVWVMLNLSLLVG